MRKFPAIVIGLGKIGQGYDYDLKDDSRILTHAAGFASHDAYDLVAGVDPDSSRRKIFQKKFGRPAYHNLESLYSDFRPEILSVTVPTSFHLEVIKQILDYRPRAILCEKPIAACLKEGREIVEITENMGCALLVNYMRRYEPGVLDLKRKIENQLVGKIYKGVVWYSNGFLNAASHFIDLLIFLLGDANKIKILSVGRRIWEGDYEVDVSIRFNDADIYFFFNRHENFIMNSMELIGTKGKITYADGGHQIRVRKSQKNHDQTRLDNNRQMIPNDLKRYQWHVLEHLKKHIVENDELNSDGRSALETLKVVENVFEMLK